MNKANKERVTDISLRFAKPSDASEIVRLIQELAAYEKEPDAATVRVDELQSQLTSENPPFECLLAEIGDGVVGFALFFQNYSTWQGKPGMYLEDLFVELNHRGSGAGRKLLKRLGEICRERGYGRMEWQVLNWNQSAIDFYNKIGAVPLDGWTKYRLSGEALEKL